MKKVVNVFLDVEAGRKKLVGKTSYLQLDFEPNL